jgi:hypothetical protein
MNARKLITTIQLAFASIKRPDISLRQFRLTDEKGMSGEITNKEWLEAGLARVDSIWQEIPNSEIEECGCLLAHMQADEFQYYLPAYLRYSISHCHKPILENDILGFTVSALHPSCKNRDSYSYRMSQLSTLNSKQKATIIEFLTFVANNAEDIQRPYAQRALETFWKLDSLEKIGNVIQR